MDPNVTVRTGLPVRLLRSEPVPAPAAASPVAEPVDERIAAAGVADPAPPAKPVRVSPPPKEASHDGWNVAGSLPPTQSKAGPFDTGAMQQLRQRGRLITPTTNGWQIDTASTQTLMDADAHIGQRAGADAALMHFGNPQVPSARVTSHPPGPGGSRVYEVELRDGRQCNVVADCDLEPDSKELKNLVQALVESPRSTFAHTQSIYVTDHLGEIRGARGPFTMGGLAPESDPSSFFIQKGQLGSLQQALGTTSHEAHHGLDFAARQRPSATVQAQAGGRLFGSGQRTHDPSGVLSMSQSDAVTDYPWQYRDGKTIAMEDFAESGRFINTVMRSEKQAGGDFAALSPDEARQKLAQHGAARPLLQEKILWLRDHVHGKEAPVSFETNRALSFDETQDMQRVAEDLYQGNPDIKGLDVVAHPDGMEYRARFADGREASLRIPASLKSPDPTSLASWSRMLNFTNLDMVPAPYDSGMLYTNSSGWTMGGVGTVSESVNDALRWGLGDAQGLKTGHVAVDLTSQPGADVAATGDALQQALGSPRFASLSEVSALVQDGDVRLLTARRGADGHVEVAETPRAQAPPLDRAPVQQQLEAARGRLGAEDFQLLQEELAAARTPQDLRAILDLIR